MIGRRLPIALLLLAVLAIALVVDPTSRRPGAPSAALSAAALSPLATRPDAGTSTWFCAGGSAAVSGVAEHTITLANPTEQAAAGTLELFIEGQEPQRFPVDVAARDERRVVLSTLAQGEWAAALVELDGGGVVVSHEVLGVGGWDGDRCSSQASDSWFLPWGQTAPQEASSLRLALFNPFAVEAVVDLTFDTEDGFRAPEALQGFLVPARRLVTVDVTNTVPVRQRISTTVVARSGHLVVDGIQSLSGTDGTITLDVTPAAPQAATSWYFADGRVDADTLERIAVYNPADTTAEVEVEVHRPRTTQELGIEPFELQIPAQSYAEVVLSEEGRIPQPLRHSTIVRSLNGVAVVAERVQLSSTVRAAAGAPGDDPAATTVPATTAVPPTAPPPTETTPPTTAAPPPPAPGDTTPSTAPPATPASTAPPGPTETTASTAPAVEAVGLVPLPPGLSASLGSPVVATQWVLPGAGRPDVAAAKAVIANPSASQPVELTVEAFAAGRAVAFSLPTGADRLEPRQQLELPVVVAADGAPVLLVVRASGPVVVDGVQTYGPLPDVSFHSAFPLPDGVRVPDPLDSDLPALGTDTTGPPAGEGTVPTGTSSVDTTAASPASTAATTTTIATTTTVAVTTAATAATVPVSEPSTAPPVTEAPPAGETTAVADTTPTA